MGIIGIQIRDIRGSWKYWKIRKTILEKKEKRKYRNLIIYGNEIKIAIDRVERNIPVQRNNWMIIFVELIEKIYLFEILSLT